VAWLLLLVACPSPTGPAPSGSRSAALAEQAAAVSRDAEVLANHTRDLEGLFDEMRAAGPGEREAVRARIAARAADLQEEAHALGDQVTAIEEGARVY
jgi:hypothetical protein